MRMTDVHLGIAPIGWTNDDLPALGAANSFEQCVSEIALAGFEGTEIGGRFPRDPALLRRHLAVRKLSICNAWFSCFLTTRAYEEVERAFAAQLDFLRAMGASVIGACEQGRSIQGDQAVPVFDGKPRFSESEWKKLADGLNRLGERARQKGMILTYHHHMGTGVQTAEEIDTLMRLTNPALVFLLYDSGHLVFSDAPYEDVLAAYAARIRHVHLKDVRRDVLERVRREKMSFLAAVKEGVFTVPGDGDIDFDPIFSGLARCGYRGWLVVEAEQDPDKANPLEYAMKARAFIRRKTGL
jgi:inosose dehydratase